MKYLTRDFLYSVQRQHDPAMVLRFQAPQSAIDLIASLYRPLTPAAEARQDRPNLGYAQNVGRSRDVDLDLP